MGISALKVELLHSSFDPENLVALAAKLCYSDAGISELREKINSSEQNNFINKIVKIGHHSVLEHVSFSFGIEGVSRALTHQLVRHRMASYSQKSQRYVKYTEGFDYILPESIKKDKEILENYHKLMEDINRLYSQMISVGIPAEDARYVLPNACETKIIVTMNARELIHFFKVRCCNRAQWEIRSMAEKMYELCLEKAPSIFKYAGPGCVFGSCPEGDMSCGSAKDVRARYAELLAKYDRLN